MAQIKDIEDVAGKTSELHFGSLKASGVTWDTISKNEDEYKRAIKDLIEWTEHSSTPPSNHQQRGKTSASHILQES